MKKEGKELPEMGGRSKAKALRKAALAVAWLLTFGCKPPDEEVQGGAVSCERCGGGETVTVLVACVVCNGTGRVPKDGVPECIEDPQGVLFPEATEEKPRHRNGTNLLFLTCPGCNGMGTITVTKRCPKCGGAEEGKDAREEKFGIAGGHVAE